MQVPEIELLPLHAALGSDSPSILDVVVKIIPPHPEPDFQRTQLNLGIVIDRSSSMSVGQRLEYAKAAARQIVNDLLPSDRISVTTFDGNVQQLLPSILAVNKAEIMNTIQQIQIGKWTNLCSGWSEGVKQVNQHIYPGTLNRVILLSDGWVTSGNTNGEMITSFVQEMAQSSISTTTVGVGNDFNEDLLEAMARSGDGNYYYVNSSTDLPNIFGKEMQALIATIGQQVTLGIEPQSEVEIEDVLNDLDTNPQGRFKLPNLVAGYQFLVVVRLNIPSMTKETDLCYFRLSINDGKQPQSQVVRVPLRLPVVNQSFLSEFPANPEVQQQVALMQAAREKRKGIAFVDRKDYEAAQIQLDKAKALISEAPTSSLNRVRITSVGVFRSRLTISPVKAVPQARPSGGA
jgi:Ca-activated chloride channel homolog